MQPTLILPRLTDFRQILSLVQHLRTEGVENKSMARRISQIGHVDLDTLSAVLKAA